ncbi:hypothetical protein [Paraburkholderia sediminicola]|uniref:hypothetical protein n=1 Tax=Paraburkholderia sediminicola TaxID=458836 RepID=UPI0038B7CC1C
MPWYDGLYSAIQGLGNSTPSVNGNTPSFAGGGNAALYGPTNTDIRNTTQGTKLPTFGMPNQTGGTVGGNAIDTNGFGSNFSKNDLSNIAMAGANMVNGKGGAFGGFDASKLSGAASNPIVQGLGDLAKVVGNSSGDGQDQQMAQLQQQQNAYIGKQRQAGAQAQQQAQQNYADSNAKMMALQQARARPGIPGILSGGFGSGGIVNI